MALFVVRRKSDGLYYKALKYGHKFVANLQDASVRKLNPARVLAPTLCYDRALDGTMPADVRRKQHQFRFVNSYEVVSIKLEPINEGRVVEV